MNISETTLIQKQILKLTNLAADYLHRLMKYCITELRCIREKHTDIVPRRMTILVFKAFICVKKYIKDLLNTYLMCKNRE